MASLARMTAMLAAMALCGCASIRITDPPRTATEQFLLSGAATRAIDQLSTEALRDRRVFVDATYLVLGTQEFVVAEVRARLLVGGVRLVQKREDAQVVLELRSGGVGIDRNDFLLGIPSIYVPTAAVAGGAPPLATPELALLKNTHQRGVASVAYVAYWADSGEVIAQSGPYIGRTLRDDWWILGTGPRTVGNIPTTEGQ